MVVLPPGRPPDGVMPPSVDPVGCGSTNVVNATVAQAIVSTRGTFHTVLAALDSIDVLPTFLAPPRPISSAPLSEEAACQGSPGVMGQMSEARPNGTVPAQKHATTSPHATPVEDCNLTGLASCSFWLRQKECRRFLRKGYCC